MAVIVTCVPCLLEMEKSEAEKMEKSDSASGLDDSLQVQVAEETVEDETQNQEDPDCQMQDNQVPEVTEEIRNETSPDMASNESGQISQPEVQQCEESIQNVPEKPPGSTGIEIEALAAGECLMQGTLQTTALMSEDSEDELGDKRDQEFPVQEVEPAVELVVQEAVVVHARQERMEEAEDFEVEEPQKYAFREKGSK